MAHVLLVYAPEDTRFARQVAIHIDQRGFVVLPVPEAGAAHAPFSPADFPIGGATHVVCILPVQRSASEDVAQLCETALGRVEHSIIIRRDDTPLPAFAHHCRSVDFREGFLVAIEELIALLTETRAPTHPLTVEYPPPVVKTGLLPITLPSERCWRDDRVRINYILPIILPPDEIALRMPAFLAKAGFELTDSSPNHLAAHRTARYPWFDPRRADHTLTVAPEEGDLLVVYQTRRTQVYHWFPAHYRVLDREAAALYRYLATGKLGAKVLAPVQVQVRRALLVSWGAIVVALLVLLLLAYLIAI